MTGADVKDNLERRVMYEGSEYYLSAYILRKIKGKLYHQAELVDLKANAVYIVPLAKEEIQKNTDKIEIYLYRLCRKICHREDRRKEDK